MNDIPIQGRLPHLAPHVRVAIAAGALRDASGHLSSVVKEYGARDDTFAKLLTPVIAMILKDIMLSEVALDEARQRFPSVPDDPHRTWLVEWEHALHAHDFGGEAEAFADHTALGRLIGDTPAIHLDGAIAQIEMVLREADGPEGFMFPAHFDVLTHILTTLLLHRG